MATVLELAQDALYQMRKTTLGYEKAKAQNPKKFAQTANGMCETDILRLIALIKSDPGAFGMSDFGTVRFGSST